MFCVGLLLLLWKDKTPGNISLGIVKLVSCENLT